jgi:hypothetical protein
MAILYVYILYAYPIFLGRKTRHTLLRYLSTPTPPSPPQTPLPLPLSLPPPLQDFWYHVRNEHYLLSMATCDRLGPYGAGGRRGIFMAMQMLLYVLCALIMLVVKVRLNLNLNLNLETQIGIGIGDGVLVKKLEVLKS